MNKEFGTVSSYFIYSQSRQEDYGDSKNNAICSSCAPRLLDFDANLFHEDLDFDSATTRAQEYGVAYFVVPGFTLEDSQQAVQAAKTISCVVAATVGVHPYNASSVPYNESNVRLLRSLSTSPYCHAVGECGLDFSDGFPEKAMQMAWFRHQVALALEIKKPLYLHLRKAFEAFKTFIENETVFSLTGKEENGQQTLRNYILNKRGVCVVHCFTGSLEELRYYVDLGCYIGLTGYIFTLSKDTQKEILNLIPSDKLVLETDAPYLGFKGCRESEDKAKSRKYPNVPAALTKIAMRVAEVLDMSYDEVCRKTTSNAAAYFNIDVLI